MRAEVGGLRAEGRGWRSDPEAGQRALIIINWQLIIDN
jgi:hypothetical protein